MKYGFANILSKPSPFFKENPLPCFKENHHMCHEATKRMQVKPPPLWKEKVNTLPPEYPVKEKD